MRHLALLAIALASAVGLGACRRSPRGHSQEPGPGGALSDAAAPSGFGSAGAPRFSGPLADWHAAPAAPGKYTMRGDRSHREFLTREHVVHRNDRVSVTLDLDPGGLALACFGRKHTRRGSARRYLRGGKHEDSSSESEQTSLVGRRGSWRVSGAWLELSFGEQQAACPFSADAGLSPAAKPLTLRCLRLSPPAAAATKATSVLGCTGADEAFTVPVGAAREAWLLLGAPGLSTSASLGHNRADLVRVTPLTEAVPHDDWKR